MSVFKKFQIFYILVLVVLFSGCIKKIDSDGLVLQIQESELNNFSQEFPIGQDFVFSYVEIQKPHIYIKNGTNRLTASVNMNISSVFIPTFSGTFALSGNPYFDKEKSAIYLKDIQIDDLKFTNVNIDKNFINTLVTNTKPTIDDIFNKVPIYKIDKSSFKGAFVKDIKIENSELLVAFGL